MPVAIAAGGALLLGTADFLAGLAGRRDGRGTGAALSAAWVASLVGLVIGGMLVWVVPPDDLTATDVAWALAAGCAVAVARPLLFVGMTRGPMAVFAPVAALVGLVVPVVVGPLIGQGIVPVEMAGIGIAVPAIVMVSSTGRLPTGRELLAGDIVGLAVLTGVAFGTSGILLSQTSTDSGVVPAVLSAVVSLVTIPGLALVGRPMVRPLGGLVRWGMLIGTVEIVAVVAKVLAFQRGSVAVVTAVLGMAPAASLVLAWRVLGERVFRLQLVGAALGTSAIVLFALA